MIPDYQKNSFAISDRLLKTNVGIGLVDHGANVLTPCRDIWCRDFMPVQRKQNEYVQFIYAPSYLVEDEDEWHTITPSGIAYPDFLRPRAHHCDQPKQFVEVKQPVSCIPLVLDGGSIAGNEDIAFVSERVFTDNREWHRVDIERALQDALDVQHVEFLPEHPDDFSGHLDGTLRIVSRTLAVIGTPPPEIRSPGVAEVARSHRRCRSYSAAIASIVSALGFEVLPLTDVSYDAPVLPPDSVKGLYANFLQLGNRILLPQYWQGKREDLTAASELSARGFEVIKIDAHEFADKKHPERAGGTVNCVTWNWFNAASSS